MSNKDEVPVPKELEDILLEFTVNVLQEKPDDIIGHAASYFTRLKHERDNTSKDSASLDSASLDSASKEEGSKSDIPQRGVEHGISGMLGDRARRRDAVMGEVFDPKKGDFETEVYPKSKQEKQRIRDRTRNVFIFKNLGENNLNAIIDAMKPTEVKEGQVIIRQEEEGDFCYVIDKGNFDTYIKEGEGKEKYVKSYKDHGIFGELALLHNQPRAATVIAKTNGKLWAISRNTFTKLVVKSAFEKRNKYTELLEKVPELKPLTKYEKLQVCDALSSVYLGEGEILFNEGEEGNGMYFIEKGVIAICKDSPSGTEQIAELNEGDYFGEMAIVEKQSRSGTAKAVKNTELAFLDVEAFERLFGPCQNIMKERMQAYKKQQE